MLKLYKYTCLYCGGTWYLRHANDREAHWWAQRQKVCFYSDRHHVAYPDLETFVDIEEINGEQGDNQP